MTKLEFLTRLREQLRNIPEEDRQRTVDYYAEMIDDRMEEGLSEEAAVAAVGDVETVAASIVGETPSAAPEAQKETSPRKFHAWEILLLILGAPVWASLLIAAVVVVFSLLVSLWAVVIVLYIAALVLGLSAVGCVLGSFFLIGSMAQFMIALGVGLLCAGTAILFFMLSNLAAKGMAALTKVAWKGLKGCFRRKEQAK